MLNNKVLLYMPCSSFDGCTTTLIQTLPVCSRNCILDSALRNEFALLNNNKKIFKMVGTTSSSYQTKLATKHAGAQLNCQVDPACPLNDSVGLSQPVAYVNRRQMGIRPGGLGTGGKNAIGCDVKHGSYARVLYRRRGSIIS